MNALNYLGELDQQPTKFDDYDFYNDKNTGQGYIAIDGKWVMYNLSYTPLASSVQRGTDATVSSWVGDSGSNSSDVCACVAGVGC